MKILLVEDEHKIANSIKKGLEQEYYVVDVRFDGTIGYDLAISEQYDCIILDRLLPGIDGLDICKALREKHIHTPILLLTAKGQLQDRVEGLNAGADDYVTKPFAFEELLARIKALLRRPKETTPKILITDNLTLNMQTYQVTRNNKEISLSQKEFQLLEFLLKQKGKVVTKDQIIARVWDYDADILPNTVEAYIKNLRNKIDKPFTKPIIHTVRGFGYKVE